MAKTQKRVIVGSTGNFLKCGYIDKGIMGVKITVNIDDMNNLLVSKVKYSENTIQILQKPKHSQKKYINNTNVLSLILHHLHTPPHKVGMKHLTMLKQLSHSFVRFNIYVVFVL